MNLPTHLTNPGSGSTEIDLYSLPTIRRNSIGFETDEEQSKAEGKRHNNDQAIIHTDDRGGIESAPDEGQARQYKSRRKRWWNAVLTVGKRHTAFIGPGIIASVGYTDPGNWVTDLAAGSQFGYKLLFIVLMSGLFGIFLQILAVRMGVVTGDDLARNTRLLLLPDDDGRLRFGSRNVHNSTPDKIKYRNLRIFTLWGLYFVSEGALIATELAELLGSAIALNLLFPGLPLYGGVLVTCADVMLFLFIYKPQGNFRIFEFLIAVLVMIVLACYIALLVRTKPNWADVFYGYVPSSTLVEAEALYTGIGIIGAVIMPHAMYLGSHFSTINRMDQSKNASRYDMDPEVNEFTSANADAMPWHQRSISVLRGYIANHFPTLDLHLRNRGHRHTRRAGQRATISALRTGLRQNENKELWASRMTIAEMKIHLPHAAWDIALSLFFFAITVNSAILIVAGAAFYYGNNNQSQLSDLYDAFNLLKNTLGQTYAILFAVALLAAGQSASITCTLAGQIVSEGFIKWRTNAFLRRMITRIITVIPSLAIAIGVGRNGLDEMLIASQVTLSFALPFVLVPLIAVTSLKKKMIVEEEIDEESANGPIPVGDREDDSKEDFVMGVPPTAVTASSSNAINSANCATPSAAPEDPLQPISTSVNEENRVSNLRSPSITSKIKQNFANKWYIIGMALVIYLVIVIADLYTLVALFTGQSG